jgi:hypothetical protein
MWNQFLDPADLARRWARRTFGSAAAPTVAQILLESPDAVALSRYFPAVASMFSAWKPALNWTRDDQIRGFNRIYPVYRRCATPEMFDAVIFEQQKAVRMAAKALEKYQEVMSLVPNRAIAQQAYDTLRYRLALYRVRQTYISGAFHYFQWLDSHGTSEEARAAAISSFRQWQRDWDSFNTEIPRLRFAASLYHGEEMVEDIEHALSLLEHPPKGGVGIKNLLRPKKL